MKTVPKIEAVGKATGLLIVKTTPADCDISDGSSVVGSVKKGATLDVIEMNYDGTNSKIRFNTKVCHIPSSNLADFTKTPSAEEIAKLGAPIGVLSVDTPWGDLGVKAYSAEGLQKLRENNFGYINVDINKLRDIAQILSGTIKTFDIKYDGATGTTPNFV